MTHIKNVAIGLRLTCLAGKDSGSNEDAQSAVGCPGRRARMSILVTGGASYIGTHTCVELLQAGHDVIVFDNFSNSHPEALKQIEQITQRTLSLVQGDVRDHLAIESALRQPQCQAAIHLAGLKVVEESVENPLINQDNNIVDTHRLLLVIEIMLRDVYRSHPDWRIVILRYFNPVGAHESGMIGEDPQGIPNSFIPYVAQVAAGRRELLNVWGNDYPTLNGTGVRDYIHVVNLALGHVKALGALDQQQYIEVNFGTGLGYSVLDVVKAFEAASRFLIA